jgi:hypothetical protein
MQRQDDFHITRTGMLLFIAQLLSLADAVIRIVAQCRTIDDRLLHSFARSEIAMLIVLGGIVSNTDTRGATPGVTDIIEFDEPPDRHAELLRIGASLHQIAMTLALILSMNPRAFRDRHRTPSFRGGHSLSSLRGGAAEPGVQRWGRAGPSAAPVLPANAREGRHSISGLRIPLRGSAMTASSAARAPP